jgi:hypothetical protein
MLILLVVGGGGYYFYAQNVTTAEASYNAVQGQASASYASIAVSGIGVAQAERDLADAQGIMTPPTIPGVSGS